MHSLCDTFAINVNLILYDLQFLEMITIDNGHFMGLIVEIPGFEMLLIV